MNTSSQCTEVADLALSNFDEHQNDTNSHDNIADNISHFVSSGSTVPCQGIQHDQVQILLSSSEIYYAAIRGIALLHWKFDNNKKTWHTLNCMGDNNTSFHDGNNCIPCCNVQNNIKKDTYPWLFEGIKVLPSTMEIIQYIQYLYSETLHKNHDKKDKKIDDFSWITIQNYTSHCWLWIMTSPVLCCMEGLQPATWFIVLQKIITQQQATLLLSFFVYHKDCNWLTV